MIVVSFAFCLLEDPGVAVKSEALAVACENLSVGISFNLLIKILLAT